MTEPEHYSVDADPLGLGLVCTQCLYDRYKAKLPPNIDERIRYQTDDQLRAHWNEVHERGRFGMQWKGTERSWPCIIRTARKLSAGVMMTYGDAECTCPEIWCLHCNYQTSDPLAVDLQRCPKCGRDYKRVDGGW